MAKKVRQQPGIQSVEVAGEDLARVGSTVPVPRSRTWPHPAHASRKGAPALSASRTLELSSRRQPRALGPTAIALGLSGLRNLNVVRPSTALRKPLFFEINEKVLLAICSCSLVVFALEESSRPVSMNIRVGSDPAHPAALRGTVFAAFMRGEFTPPLVEVEQRRAPRFRDPKIVEEAQQRGFAAVQRSPAPPPFQFRCSTTTRRIAGVMVHLGTKRSSTSPRREKSRRCC